jgi:hypothetical protein
VAASLSGPQAEEKLTLEELFLRIVSGSSPDAAEEAVQELSWLA